MKIKVLFFASLRDIVRVPQLEISNCSGLNELKSKLAADYPGIMAIPFVIAVNNKIEHSDIALKDGDEIALLPPFSGG